MDKINLILISGTFLLGSIAVISLFRSNKKKVEKEILSDKVENVAITLDELSKIWARSQETGEMPIQDISPIWKEPLPEKDKEKKEYEFQTEAVAGFFAKYIENAAYFKSAELQKEVCYQLLIILEKDGGCPSVVNAPQDIESSWDSNTYQLLGRTTLLNHTLNVARKVVEILVEEKSEHVLPDTIIAALGHDLGKLPAARGFLYSLGEHPLAAGKILAELPEYKQLKRKEEITRAIKFHHKMPEGLIGKTLKKADQQARQLELEDAIENTPEPEIVKNKCQSGDTAPPSVPEPSPSKEKDHHSSSSPVGSSAAWQAQADIYGEEEDQRKKSTKKSSPERIDITSWFDSAIFLENVKPYINRLNGRRFMAFSMSNGYVYIQAKVLEEVARKQAEQAGAMEIVTLGVNDLTMRGVLLSIVDRLRIENDIIARELVKDNYFGGFFIITTTSGRKMKGFYTPFHAEAFGSIAEMEQQKSGILKTFKSVEAFTGEGEQ